VVGSTAALAAKGRSDENDEDGQGSEVEEEDPFDLSVEELEIGRRGLRPGAKVMPREELKQLRITPLDPMEAVVKHPLAHFGEGVPKTPYERLQSWRGKDRVKWAFGDIPKPPPRVDPRKYVPTGPRQGRRGRIKPEAKARYNAHKAEAKLAVQTERYEDGIWHVDAGLEAVPNKWSLFHLRAICHANMGLWAMTLQDADKCLALHPSNFEGSFYRAYALFRMKRYLEAGRECKRGLSIYPDHVALNDLFRDCLALLRKGVGYDGHGIRWCNWHHHHANIVDEQDRFYQSLTRSMWISGYHMMAVLLEATGVAEYLEGRGTDTQMTVLAVENDSVWMLTTMERLGIFELMRSLPKKPEVVAREAAEEKRRKSELEDRQEYLKNNKGKPRKKTPVPKDKHADNVAKQSKDLGSDDESDGEDENEAGEKPSTPGQGRRPKRHSDDGLIDNHEDLNVEVPRCDWTLPSRYSTLFLDVDYSVAIGALREVVASRPQAFKDPKLVQMIEAHVISKQLVNLDLESAVCSVSESNPELETLYCERKYLSARNLTLIAPIALQAGPVPGSVLVMQRKVREAGSKRKTIGESINPYHTSVYVRNPSHTQLIRLNSGGLAGMYGIVDVLSHDGGVKDDLREEAEQCWQRVKPHIVKLVARESDSALKILKQSVMEVYPTLTRIFKYYCVESSEIVEVLRNGVDFADEIALSSVGPGADGNPRRNGKKASLRARRHWKLAIRAALRKGEDFTDLFDDIQEARFAEVGWVMRLNEFLKLCESCYLQGKNLSASELTYLFKIMVRIVDDKGEEKSHPTPLEQSREIQKLITLPQFIALLIACACTQYRVRMTDADPAASQCFNRLYEVYLLNHAAQISSDAFRLHMRRIGIQDVITRSIDRLEDVFSYYSRLGVSTTGGAPDHMDSRQFYVLLKDLRVLAEDESAVRWSREKADHLEERRQFLTYVEIHSTWLMPQREGFNAFRTEISFLEL